MATNQVNKDTLVDQLLTDNDIEKTLALDFSQPIFKTPVGEKLAQLITSLINKNGDARPQLEEIIEACESLQHLIAKVVIQPALVDYEKPEDGLLEAVGAYSTIKP
ncbi:hypothetical protein [Legionella gresilensis]|uniref:hypothetical protein n=1 Tax=Legionella gresilensis TaxID=91823 RepID=UPI00104100BE|nr:hypothetical protein [Legionella gresilensis]